MIDARTISETLGGKQSGTGYIACCPAHDDRNPSLSINDGDNGKPLVHCHAGCSQEDIIAALSEMGAWTESDTSISRKEVETRRRGVASRKATLEATKQARQESVAIKAQQEWKTAQSAAPVHPYLAKKRIKHHGIKQKGDMLLVPMKDEKVKIWALQTIDLNGEKRFQSGARTQGLYYSIGPKATPGEQICICEGFATAAAIYEATGISVAVAFSAGNLKPVALLLKEKFPDNSLILCADDDHKEGTDKNPGIEAATKAALAAGGLQAVPDMGKKADFWDLWNEQGDEAIKTALLSAQKPVELDTKVTHDMVENALEAIRAAIAKTCGETPDPGAVFESHVVDALRLLRQLDHAEFQRQRAAIKKTSKDIRMSDLDSAIKNGKENEVEKETAGILVDMARKSCTLFHSPDNNAYAVFEEAGHRECWPINGEGFSAWLSFQHYMERGRVPGESPLKAAVATLTGIAKFEGEERSVHLRVAKHNDDFWLDLCDAGWRAIQITKDGWGIDPAPPVMFTRTKAMSSLPEPKPGGNLALLWRNVNIPEDEQLIVLAWLLECLRPETPYAILELTGEEGSAKSSTQHYLREIIDPNRVNLRAAPKNIEDVFISARNAHLVSYNNLSYMKPEYQDALCVLATGGGYAGRTLYTNGDETVMELKKPVMLNGIATVVTAQDLLGRTVHIDLPSIELRLSEVEIKQDFEENKGAILGGLLDLFAKVLAILPEITIPENKRPRMADFSYLGEAVYRVHGRKPGEFLADYEEKRRDGVHRTIDASPVAVACQSFLDKNPEGFEGTIKGLYEAVTKYKPEGEAWPRSPKGFADGLRRIAPALRLVGINARIFEQRTAYGYTCVLKTSERGISPEEKVSETCSSSSSSSSSSCQPHLGNEHDEHHERKTRKILSIGTKASRFKFPLKRSK